ncbi:hypothetical protein ABMY35_00960 [Pseudoalteromonas sp. BZB3]|uniref:lipopolysaccharide biosynthesis protein n=1 Tax=Pseudoalteromonas sp. BZB3 TaxID=3136670 RepID=UPI0032C40D51
MNFKKAFGYSAIESIFSRLFDLVSIWIVLNTLGVEDVALFGLATSALFFFNLFFITPETALFKYQKDWMKSGQISSYLSAFYSFNIFKLLVHYIAGAIVLVFFDDSKWLFFAIVFSAITQKIQLAEISRIYFRMELKQKQVALFELASKCILLLLVSSLYFFPDIGYYFTIYLLWSAVVALSWVLAVKEQIGFSITFDVEHISKLKFAFLGFSGWAHLTGVMTFCIYNSSVLFLEWFDTEVSELALFVVLNKVANLFFVIPMFFQSFVPVLLANSNSQSNKRFKKLVLASSILSTGQLIFFALFGRFIASVFGVSEQDTEQFYELGLFVTFGIFVLNLNRPLSTFLLIKTNPKNLFLAVSLPSFCLAIFTYPLLINFYGLKGAAYSAVIVYSVMSLLLLVGFILYRKKNNEHISCNSNL